MLARAPTSLGLEVLQVDALVDGSAGHRQQARVELLAAHT